MGEVVNLRQRRKAKARADGQQVATANRALHGRTRDERLNEESETARRTALLDGAKRED